MYMLFGNETSAMNFWDRLFINVRKGDAASLLVDGKKCTIVLFPSPLQS